MTDAVPNWELPVIPTSMKPICAIEEKARNRFKLFCLMAKRLPIMMVSKESRNKILYQISARGVKTVYKTEINTKITAPFEITDRYEVTATGAPSYTSAVHK